MAQVPGDDDLSAPALSPLANSPAPAPAPLADSPATALAPEAAPLGRVFDVTKYGAVADGKTENNLAFSDAWNAACKYSGNATFFIPKGTFFLGPVSFNGPCYNKQSPKVEIRGTLKAPSSLNAFPAVTWIIFQGLHGFNLTGAETALLDAQGAEAWTQSDCLKKEKCDNFPTSLRFIEISGGTMANITLMNSKAFHISFLNCNDIVVHGINITAPWDSPNTDGIHISNSTNIQVTSSTIGVGDDCVSIGPGNTNVSVSNIKCGPGHGISVGSLGKYPNEKDVVGVSVKNCTISGTTNGVRIKTWPGSPASKAYNLTFEDIVMTNVSNPIIIDQEYCPWHSCNSKPSLVKLSNIHFKKIRGTYNTKSAVTLLCSSIIPCNDIQLMDINLTSMKVDGQVASTFLMMKGTSNGVQIVNSCC
ncbi:hypothetical protein HHK36_032631 [Tetracentron sinense]|uniref:Exopolygalacturonase-like n=1 Tax=Tetracentron sinense TaxID=13715 RepID=A0A835D088_TETSI|nr:hypothetical protein HHK36_032631 [Tetracentron sinense]